MNCKVKFANAVSSRPVAEADRDRQAGPDSHTVDETDFAKLEARGFSREDIWDIAAITGFYGLSNRMANVIGIMPNAEFYTMGR